MEGALTLDVSTRLYGRDEHQESCVVLFFRRKLPLREIVAEKVRTEVQKATKSRKEYASTRYLVEEELSWTRNGAMEAPKPKIDPEHEVLRAWEAFLARRYFIYIDGARREDLDEVITLAPETKIQFVRIMPLVGG